MTFLKRFVIAWREAATQKRYDEFADSPQSWGPDDASWLLQVMNSYSGKRLKARMVNMVFRSAWEACSANDKSDYERGMARGVADTITSLEQHMNAELYKVEDFTPDEAHSSPIDISSPAPVI